MKDLIFSFINDAEWQLNKIAKSEMKLKDRLAYEKALTKLEDLKKVLHRLSITSNQ